MSEPRDSWLTRQVNAAISKLISYDPKAGKKLQTLAGKTIRVEIQPVKLSFELTITAESIVVSNNPELSVNTTISGKPSALFAMSSNQHIPGLDGVQIRGDASAGQFVADFLKQLKPDWEDAWCDLLGEGPGYQVSQLLAQLKISGQRLAGSLRRNTREYLLEENRELVSAREMDDFLDQVDDLRADLVRVERKLNALKNHS